VRRRSPRPASLALQTLVREWAPSTPLAAVQGAWPEVVGPTVAAEAEPVAERSGVVTVACRSAVWAQELDLMAPDLVARLNAALDGVEVSALRCRTQRGSA
jgi:predicted nucleic acid-binding Zn ribbon protein